METTNPELLKEWDYSKNIITPKEIKAGSGTKVWWKCSLGHSWSASPNHRTKGRGCPICANKVVLLGYNDLTTLKPNIASEWDYEKMERKLLLIILSEVEKEYGGNVKEIIHGKQ